MLFLTALIIASAFAFFCGKPLKKHPYIFYSAAALLTLAMAFLPSFDTHSLPVFVNTYILGLFTRGALATALWCVVMITGALPNGSVLIKKLMPIRGELSIFTAILTLGHNIGYGRTYFTMLFTNADRMSVNQICASICTIIMLIIMIPLTVMSFPGVRKRMNAKLWKKIQRAAYIFYALIYVHVMLLTVPMARAGREGYIFSILMYSLVFFGYAFFRIRKLLAKKELRFKRAAEITTLVFSLFMIFLMPIAARPAKQSDASKGTGEAKTYTITTASSASSATLTSTLTTTTVSVSSSTGTTSSAVTTETDSPGETTTSAAPEEVTEAPQDEPLVNEPDQPQEQPQNPETPSVIPNEPAAAPPEPQYIYNNGSYTASADGYDGEVTVTITIENDVITQITGYSNETDTWYYDKASEQIIPAILNSQSTDVDVYSGATYSSNAIIKAVSRALKAARK